MQDKIKQLYEFINYEAISKQHSYEKDIIETYGILLKEIVKSYEDYRKYYGAVLACFEQYYVKALSYSIHHFFVLFEECIKYPINTQLDFSIQEADFSSQTLKTYEEILRSNFQKNSGYRLSKTLVDTGQISQHDLKELASLITYKLQELSKKITWNNEDIQHTILELTILRGICKKLNNVSLFYQISNSFFDRLYTSELYQVSRDLCEDFLIISFVDKVPVYGFFICMRSYSNHANVHASLIFASLTLICVQNDKKIINDKFLFEVVWQSMKLFRNNGLLDYALQVYALMPSKVSLSSYEKHSIDHSYYSILLMKQGVELPFLLAEYLDKERENILQEDEYGCMPWLVLLYNIKRLSKIFDFEGSGLNSYLNIFEAVVPVEMVGKYKNIINGDSRELKKLIKESLLKLLRTRNRSDYVYDNEMTMKIASRLVGAGFIEKDEEAVLLGTLVRSDFSILFKNTDSLGEMPLADIDVEIGSFYDFYINPVEAVSNIKLIKDQQLICLLAPEDNLFQLTYSNGERYYDKLEFDANKYNEWVRKYVPKYSLKTELPKDRYGNSKTKFVEDYESELIEVINQIGFPNVKYSKKAREVLLIKDMELSELPHNLLLDENKEFVALKCPISNVVSVEWLNSRVNSCVNVDNSISFWIPTESGDGTISMLYGKLEDVIKDYNILTFQTTKINAPISSVINIISSHGSNDIATLQVIHPSGNEVVYDLERIIGEGKILVMLVCYSGSATKSFFKNEVLSIVRKYLSQGYQAVIAPFWALHVDIPPIWLPVFIKELELGETVSNAVFKANLEVYKTYPTPAAWACMHLYGNALFTLK